MNRDHCGYWIVAAGLIAQFVAAGMSNHVAGAVIAGLAVVATVFAIAGSRTEPRRGLAAANNSTDGIIQGMSG